MIAPAYKPLRPLKMSELSPEGQAAYRAMRRAAKKVREEHRRFGLPLIVSENGRIVKKPA